MTCVCTEPIIIAITEIINGATSDIRQMRANWFFNCIVAVLSPTNPKIVCHAPARFPGNHDLLRSQRAITLALPKTIDLVYSCFVRIQISGGARTADRISTHLHTPSFMRMTPAMTMNITDNLAEREPEKKTVCRDLSTKTKRKN